MPSICHRRVIDLAVSTQQRSVEKYASAPNSIVRDGFFVLVHDAVCAHRALAAVIDAGWPGPGATMARILMDQTVSAIAISNSQSPEMAAFRYLYGGLRRHQRDQAFPASDRRAMFGQIRRRLALFTPQQRSEAAQVLRERDRQYWFNPEFKSPADVIDRFAVPGLRWVYLQLSGTAHGSFFGMRLFRENPDAISINPEPPGRRALALDLLGCRLLLELLLIRDTVERLGMATEIQDLMGECATVAIAAGAGPNIPPSRSAS